MVIISPVLWGGKRGKQKIAWWRFSALFCVQIVEGKKVIPAYLYGAGRGGAEESLVSVVLRWHA